jgi:hypothetical protein
LIAVRRLRWLPASRISESNVLSSMLKVLSRLNPGVGTRPLFRQRDEGRERQAYLYNSVALTLVKMFSPGIPDDAGQADLIRRRGRFNDPRGDSAGKSAVPSTFRAVVDQPRTTGDLPIVRTPAPLASQRMPASPGVGGGRYPVKPGRAWASVFTVERCSTVRCCRSPCGSRPQGRGERWRPARVGLGECDRPQHVACRSYRARSALGPPVYNHPQCAAVFSVVQILSA